MATAKSTRLNIVEQSLADILERLADLQPTEPTVMKLRELRTKAFAYERTVKTWAVNAPSEAQRQAMLKLVLELNVQVMELARATREGPKDAEVASTERPEKPETERAPASRRKTGRPRT
jgi:hypothetical protein